MKFTLTAISVICHVFLSNSAKSPSTIWSEDTTPSIAQSSLKFAWDGYKALDEPSGKNVFYSPYSIMNAFGMLILGSGGQLETKLKNALRIPPSLNGNQLHQQLSNENNKLSQEQQATIGVGNRFFINNNLVSKINPEYSSSLAQYYNSSLQATPFSENPQQSKASINGFVSEKTHGQITNLLEQPPNSNTLVMLVNAIYFKGEWTEPFEEFMTQPDSFQRKQGGNITVDFMRKMTRLEYTNSNELQAQMVALPYTDSKKYAFYVILPSHGSNLTYLEERLNDTKIRQLVSSLHWTQVDLKMPKFSMKNRFKLNTMLENLGATGIGDPQDSQNSKMFTEPIDGAFVDEVIHEAKVQVNENGTVAAGATSIGIALSMLPVHVPVYLNRPFLFFIADISNGFVLFWGRVEDPSS